mgnify:CR=1 FL=1
MQKFMVLGAVLWSMVFSGSIALAQNKSSKKVAEEKDWSVFVDSNPQECWAVSQPQETRVTLNGKVVPAQRGKILLFVLYRPGEDLSGQITFTGGYPFAKKAVGVDIDGKTYSLPTVEDRWAWAATSEDDKKILDALRKGGKAIITGRSSRGKTTMDTFSLRGLTAATNEARRRCSR